MEAVIAVLATLTILFGGLSGSLNEKLEQARKEVQAAQERMAALEQQNSALKTENALLREQINLIQAKLDAALEYQANVENINRTLTLEKESLTRTIRGVDRLSTKLAGENAELRSGLESLKNSYEEALRSLNFHKTEFEKRQVLIDLGLKHANELRAAKGKIRVLADELSLKSSALADLEQKNAELQSELADAKDKLSQAVKDLSFAADSLKYYSQQSQKLKNGLIGLLILFAMACGVAIYSIVRKPTPVRMT